MKKLFENLIDIVLYLPRLFKFLKATVKSILYIRKKLIINKLLSKKQASKLVAEAFETSSIENDYRWLMGAKVLVPSWGTFCDPAISLNSKLECIYKFSDDQIVQNTYIKRGEWNASPDQIQLMTDLPIECII